MRICRESYSGPNGVEFMWQNNRDSSKSHVFCSFERSILFSKGWKCSPSFITGMYLYFKKTFQDFEKQIITIQNRIFGKYSSETHLLCFIL